MMYERQRTCTETYKKGSMFHTVILTQQSMLQIQSCFKLDYSHIVSLSEVMVVKLCSEQFILFHGDASGFRYCSLPRNVKSSQVTKFEYRLLHEHLINRRKTMVRRGFTAHEDVTAASSNKASIQRYSVY